MVIISIIFESKLFKDEIVINNLNMFVINNFGLLFINEKS